MFAATLLVGLTTVIGIQDTSLAKGKGSINAMGEALVEVVQVRSLFGDMHTITPDGGLKAAFDHIANGNLWGSSESVSGKGSELSTTSTVRKCLGQWIEKYNVKIFMDIPCGDANWQGHIPGIDNITYKGFDIAEEPVKLARTKNAQHPHMSFGNLDLTSQVPQDSPDILLVRDVIQHLSLERGAALLANAKASGARYLAVSTWVDGHGKNIDIASGLHDAQVPNRHGSAITFYKDDVHAAPFGLPKPVETCDNYSKKGYHVHDKLELIDLSTWSPQHPSGTQASSLMRHEVRP
jgi:hypothetical protein